MKKLLTMMSAVLFAAVVMTSCGGSGNEMEKDAKKLAEVACEMRMMALELDEGDFAGLSEFTQKMAEFSELAQEIETKYQIEEDDEEFEQLIRKALKSTPCGDIDLDDLFDFF
jgi:hypothetical protein